jgi:murein DD-endopeptidase MepM/ murein hydrolase activator NlpD
MKKEFVFKKLSLSIYQLAFIIVIAGTLVAGMAMFFQYDFLRRRSHELLDLQKEYRSYLVKLKSLIDDFQKVSDQDSSSLVDEKKKFLAVNRSPEYLKKSLIQYLRNNNLEYELNELQKLNFVPDSIISGPVKRFRSARKVQNESSYYLIRSISDIDFSWPLDFNSFWISSYFGPRKNVDRSNGFHYGLDLAALSGTIVKSAALGIVKEAGYSPGYGNTILLEHSNRKYKTRYAHLNSINVRVGQKIQRGAKIGTVGNTGLVRSSGKDPSHLHFEVYIRNKRVNPLWILPRIKLK